MPIPNLTIGDLLKSEADRMSREAITAPEGTKIGQFVEHPVLGLPLVALSDEINGKVLVQPGQSVIFMDNILPEDLPKGVTAEELASASLQHGIKYVSTKNPALPAPVEAPAGV